MFHEDDDCFVGATFLPALGASAQEVQPFHLHVFISWLCAFEEWGTSSEPEPIVVMGEYWAYKLENTFLFVLLLEFDFGLLCFSLFSQFLDAHKWGPGGAYWV